jgi:aldehyde dehydrogenase (NAD+)
MNEGKLLIGGRWCDADDLETLPVVNPNDGLEVGRLARGAAVDIDRAVQAARAALTGEWGRLAAVDRGRLLYRLGEQVAQNEARLADIETKDVGKPLTQARNDARALARYCEFYAGAADKLHGETIPYQNGYTVLTLREPHGVTAHIIPWNYPLQIIGRSVIGALAAGNAVVVKPGEDASLSSLAFGELTLAAGFPAGAVNIVTGYGEEAGAALASHPAINHLSFTGSTRVGTLVQQAAAVNTVPVTLELGGKSPQLIFADADLDAALPFVVNAAIQNAGQTCSAGSRVLLADQIYPDFTRQLAERFNDLTVGPAADDYAVGPLINRRQLERVEKLIETGRELTVLAQGRIVESAPPGGFYAVPLLLDDVPPMHTLAQEEIFGPVLSVIRFYDEDEAVRIADCTRYGLVAGIWTRDGGRQLRVARKLRAGQVFVNNYGAGGGVELPFGGVKGSGYGREKGLEALNAFTTIKTIAIRHG